MTALSSLKKQLKKENLDGLLVTKQANVSYLSAFSGEDSCILITRKKDFFITDSRYLEQAKKEIGNFNIEIIGGAGISGFLADFIEKCKMKRLAFEAKHISYGKASQIRDRLKGTDFVPAYDLVEKFRIIKSPSEIKLIKKAVRITTSVFDRIKSIVRPGRKEKDIAAFMEYQMKVNGAGKASFDTIVLSGKKSSLPHGRPSQDHIKNNDIVLIDGGACFAGYNSDLTRMFFLGKIPRIIKKIYSVVKTAQEKAIKAIRPGIKASKIDAIARNYITKQGFGKNFWHSLGHGIGREIHEAPSLSALSETILRPGMVFTVEPAVYIPGIGGIRIEDITLVTENKAEVLSR